jgi:hypothetical protein
MTDVKKIIEDEGPTRKLANSVPEGFVLVHEKTLEDLKDFEVWKQWIHDEVTIKELNNKNYTKHEKTI